jgi:hypothetical protein
MQYSPIVRSAAAGSENRGEGLLGARPPQEPATRCSWNRRTSASISTHVRADAGRALLDLGADVRARDLSGTNAMHRAAASGSIGVARLILQAWPEAVHSMM